MLKPRVSTLLLFTILFGGMLGICTLGHGQVLEQTFTDAVANFKISTPNSQWHLEPRGSAPGAQRAVILFESALHQFVPNVTVRVLAVTGEPQKLEDWFQKELQSLPSALQIQDQKKITLGGLKGFEVAMKDPNSHVLFLQWFFLTKDRSYVITCTAKEDSYPRLLKDFRQILNSFQII